MRGNAPSRAHPTRAPGLSLWKSDQSILEDCLRSASLALHWGLHMCSDSLVCLDQTISSDPDRLGTHFTVYNYHAIHIHIYTWWHRLNTRLVRGLVFIFSRYPRHLLASLRPLGHRTQAETLRTGMAPHSPPVRTRQAELSTGQSGARNQIVSTANQRAASEHQPNRSLVCCSLQLLDRVDVVVVSCPNTGEDL